METKCKDKVAEELKDRIKDLTKLWEAYQSGDEDKYSDDLGNIFEYGLCFDYVPKGTFSDQNQGFFRYQLSTGGPGDEFRFFVDADKQVYKIEYWYLDWFDGAKKILRHSDYDLLNEIFEWFKDAGSVDAELKKAMEYD